MLALLILAAVSVAVTGNRRCMPEQLTLIDAADIRGPSTGGVPIIYNNPKEFSSPLNDRTFMDSMTQLNREVISELPVHPKGSGAYGTFEVTDRIDDITSAEFLNEVGKKTPVVVRVSSPGDIGGSDFGWGFRTFTIRFYTEEGNLDLLGLHTQMTSVKDANRFATDIHSTSRKPDSNLYDWDTYWDSVYQMNESLNIFTRHYSDNEGIPASFCNMAAFPIHTYQFINKKLKIFFARIHIMPTDGIKTFTPEEVKKHMEMDPDYLMRDFYERIKNGNYPSWKMGLQIIPLADLKQREFKDFDSTREICTNAYPVRYCGLITLNRLVENYRNEIGRMAFSPSNLVPGILPPPDTLYQARSFAYPQAHLCRLGKNFNNIPVNCPLHTVHTYNRDGAYPLGDNQGNTTNYYPNSFDGPETYDRLKYINRRCKQQGLTKIKEISGANNFDQVHEFYNKMDNGNRTSLARNMASTLKLAQPHIQEKITRLCTSVHEDLGKRLAHELKK